MCILSRKHPCLCDYMTVRAPVFCVRMGMRVNLSVGLRACLMFVCVSAAVSERSCNDAIARSYFCGIPARAACMTQIKRKKPPVSSVWSNSCANAFWSNPSTACWCPAPTCNCLGNCLVHYRRGTSIFTAMIIMDITDVVFVSQTAFALGLPLAAEICRE